MSEWISVKDRLPKFNKEVLTYTPHLAMPIIVDTYDGYYGEDDEEWHEGWRYRGDCTGNKVTHWIPLPKPPEVNITQLNRVKRFECKSCGCIFEADKTEYRSNSQYNETYYYCECPFCKKDTGGEVICRSLLGILKNNGDLNDVIEE